MPWGSSLRSTPQQVHVPLEQACGVYDNKMESIVQGAVKAMMESPDDRTMRQTPTELADAICIEQSFGEYRCV